MLIRAGAILPLLLANVDTHANVAPAGRTTR